MKTIESYYRVLDLEVGASVEEIHQAYRDLTNVWHPDRFTDARLRARAEARMRDINEAYGVIRKIADQQRSPAPAPTELTYQPPEIPRVRRAAMRSGVPPAWISAL